MSNIDKKFGMLEAIKTIIRIVRIVRRHNIISDKLKNIEDKDSVVENLTDQKYPEYFITDIDTKMKIMGFRKVTKDDYKKADDICRELIRYIAIRYPDLSPTETYIALKSLIRSFEDYTEYTIGEKIKMIKNEKPFDYGNMYQ